MRTGQLLKSKETFASNCSVRTNGHIIIDETRKLLVTTKTFSKTVKPLFSNEIQGSANITLLENDVVESDDARVAEILNGYFVDITKTLGVACEEDSTNLDISSQDTLQMTIQRFQCHPSILKIRATVNSSQSFSLHQITVQEMFNHLTKLDPKKATPQEAIPAKILQADADLFSLPLTESFNKLVVDRVFPDDLKLADNSSLYKKDDNMKKQNCRPICLFPAVFKGF